MSRLTVQGTLTDRGKAPASPVPLKVTLTLSRDDTHFTYTDAIDVLCPTDGAFAAEFVISADTEAAFTVSGAPASGHGNAAGRITVRVETYADGVPPLDFTSPVVASFSRDQTFLGVAATLVDKLAYPVDLTGLAHYTFTALLRSDDSDAQSAFKNVDQLTCELMRDTGRTPAKLVRGAPGDNGMPTDPQTEAAVDAFNDAILNGPAPGQSEDAWEAELSGLKDQIIAASFPGDVVPPGDFTPFVVYATAPGLRDGDDYTAHLWVPTKGITGRTFYARFRSDGPKLANQIVLRSVALPVQWPGGNYGLITRVNRPTGIGSISAPLPDRTYQAPFVLMDPDLDLVDGKLRVRGRVGVGTGANMVLATVASIDVTLSLALHDYSSLPYSMDELDEFFDLQVVSTDVDILPGTDLDELPPWVWAAIAVFGFPIGLSDAALAMVMVAAIELALRPVVSDLVLSETVAQLANRLRSEVNKEINDDLAETQDEFGVALTDTQQTELRNGAWVSAQQLDIDDDGITVTGYGGVWDPLVAAVNADCPTQSDAARRSIDTDDARRFEQQVTTPDLSAWVTRYNQHRRELRQLLATRPATLAKVAGFVRAHRATVSGGDSGVVTPALVADWHAASEALRRSASPSLAALLTDVDGVLTASAGRTIAQARSIAAAHARTTSRKAS
jgi:predicted nucleic acid-binding protein